MSSKNYESQISFVLDTICPWTYLAKKRLDEALTIVRSSPTSSAVTFSIRYLPFQLYPDFPSVPVEKYNWYKSNKYDGSEEKMSMYTSLMGSYGTQSGIAFRFDGPIANTLPAHRLIQHYQVAPHGSKDKAESIVKSLYEQYFERACSPASHETLLIAAVAAGIDRDEAETFIKSIDPEYYDEASREVKALIREQKGNGVDSVPYVVFEGRKRDLDFVGAKEVGDYVRGLEQIIKESG